MTECPDGGRGPGAAHGPRDYHILTLDSTPPLSVSSPAMRLTTRGIVLRALSYLFLWKAAYDRRTAAYDRRTAYLEASLALQKAQEPRLVEQGQIERQKQEMAVRRQEQADERLAIERRRAERLEQKQKAKNGESE